MRFLEAPMNIHRDHFPLPCCFDHQSQLSIVIPPSPRHGARHSKARAPSEATATQHDGMPRCMHCGSAPPAQGPAPRKTLHSIFTTADRERRFFVLGLTFSINLAAEVIWLELGWPMTRSHRGTSIFCTKYRIRTPQDEPNPQLTMLL